MARDKKQQPIKTGDAVVLLCERLHGEKMPPGWVFLRTLPDAEGYCHELAVHETQTLTDGRLFLVPATVDNAHPHDYGRNLLVRIRSEEPGAAHFFAISSQCVLANQESLHGSA